MPDPSSEPSSPPSVPSARSSPSPVSSASPRRDGVGGAWSRRRVLRAGGGLAAALAAPAGLAALGGCCGMLEDENEEPQAAGPAGGDGPDPRGAAPDAGGGALLPAPPSVEPEVRVRIGDGPASGPLQLGETGERLAVAAAGGGDGLGDVAVGVTLLEPGGDSGPGVDRGASAGDADLLARGLPAPVTLARRRGGWIWVDGEGRTGHVAAEAIDVGRPRSRSAGPAGPADGPGASRAAAGPDPAGSVRWAGATWPGRLRLLPGADVIHVVAVVPMEAYLPGVLARELFASWRRATFEAQAIAARSFATFELLDRPGRPWDVESDERSQVFRGTTELAVARAAVAATAGVLLTYGGGVVPGYYSSACGGLGMPATVAIGPRAANAVPPLTGHAIGDCCARAPRFAWTAVRTLERLREQLDRWGRAGGPTALAGIGPIRDVRVSERTASGRPLAHAVEPAGGPPVTIPAPHLRRALMRSRHAAEDPVWSSFLEPVVDRGGGVVRLSGRGFGHGAGLCQHGAEALAGAGRTAAAILAAYYPGADLTAAWRASASA